MRVRIIVSVLVAGLALSACGSGGAEPKQTQEIRITLAGSRFVPDTVSVKVGTRVTFVVVNDDAVEHEMVIGDESVQAEHEATAQHGGHSGGGPGQVRVPAKSTKRMSFTFTKAGTLIYGCHLSGHYAAGMKGTVTVTG